jgi:hypothetical protein
MRSAKENNLYRYLKGYATHSANHVKDLVNFELDKQLPQRKLVEFGQVVSRIVAMDHVIHLEHNGFRKDLINNTLAILRQEISTLVNTFQFPNSTMAIVDYQEDSYWFNL